jgi:hypothetical protein
MIAAAVAMVILLGWLGHRAFAPVANVETDATRSKDAFMAKIAHEAGPTADINKINPDDRAKYLDQFKNAPVDPQAVLQKYIAAHGSK